MQNKIFALIGADADAQQRYFDTFRPSEYLEPERALVLALLEDAIHCYRKFATAHSRSGREQFREIEEWLMGGGNGWVFSFDNVCELLGLDPQYVRRGIRESAASAMEQEGPRRRHHARHRRAA